ncbi:MAG: hypothetical protein DCC71_16555 [Proteobacteria bacterium]|nr:MAG: hypothetical protein DCC71_16555 [Pseudomonadota bacterium]
MSPFVAGVRFGLALERSGTLLTTIYAGCDPILCEEEFFEFVRIDPDTGTQTPLGELVSPGAPTRLAVGRNGERVVFMGTTPFQDSLAIRWTPSGNVALFVDDGFNGMAFHHSGTLVVGGYDDGVTGIPEIRRWSVAPALVLASFEQPFGVGAIDAALPACRDGLDNDGDGTADWNGADGLAADAACDADPWRDRETVSQGGGCGLGAELALALPLLFGSRRRR